MPACQTPELATPLLQPRILLHLSLVSPSPFLEFGPVASFSTDRTSLLTCSFCLRPAAVPPRSQSQRSQSEVRSCHQTAQDSVGFHLAWDGTWPCRLSDLLPFLSLESFCISHSDVPALLEPARNVSSSVWLWTCIFPGNSQVNTPRLPSLIALLKLEALFSNAPGFSFLLYFST